MTLNRFFLLPFILVLTVSMAWAQGTSVAFGTIKQDTNQPVEATSDNLSVDQATGTAIFTGNVVIGQGEMRLSAPRVEIVYLAEQKGISRLNASGGITLVSGPDAAEAESAVYNLERGTIVLSGNVLLVQGPSAISAERMEVNLSNGTARMSGRVKTILNTGSN